MIRIYVFGDRPALIAACRHPLGRLGHVVYTPPEPIAFLEGVYASPPHLLLIDLVGDSAVGLQLCRELRPDPRSARIPILAVVNPVVLRGWNPSLGFDDFLVEPFSPEEVEARVRQVQFRLLQIGVDERVQIGPLQFDLGAWQATLDGQVLALTRLEFELLRFLATHAGVAFTRETLLDLVWGENYHGGTRTVDVHVRRLRAKLGPEHDTLIQTVHGHGYRFGDANG